MRLRTLSLCALLAAAPAFADEGAMDYRHHTMEAIGGHTVAFFDILQGKVPHSDHLALHAGAIADLSAVVGTLFEVNAPGGHALPAIWEDPEDFATKVADFQAAAQGLRDAIANGDAVGPAAQALGGACKGCHDSYREE